jgi:HPt (histidine-containing phosphotransfer) domain-containing protein
MELNISGVNTELGLSYYDDDPDIYIQLLRSYIVNAPVSLDKMSKVTAETLKEYIVTVHGLKGTSASLGAETVREAAFNLEKMARAGDIEWILANNENFIKNTGKIVNGIKEWLEGYDAVNKKPVLKAPDQAALERLKQGCKNFSMKDIDMAISELESADYEQDADFVAWLKEKINVSEFSGITEKIENYIKSHKED